MGSADGTQDYKGMWEALQGVGYRARPFEGNHVELLGMSEERLEVYHFPPGVPESMRYQMLVHGVWKAIANTPAVGPTKNIQT